MYTHIYNVRLYCTRTHIYSIKYVYTHTACFNWVSLSNFKVYNNKRVAQTPTPQFFLIFFLVFTFGGWGGDLDSGLHLCWLTFRRSAVSSPVFGDRSAAQLHQCGKQVHVAGGLVYLPATRDVPWPTQNSRHPDPSLPIRGLPCCSDERSKVTKAFLSSNLSAWLVSKQRWVGH